MPKNAGGGLKLRLHNLQDWIFSTWSAVGYHWRTIMNLQNGSREIGRVVAADSARRLTPTAYRCGHLPVRGVPPSRDRNSARQWPSGRLQLSAAISGLRVTL